MRQIIKIGLIKSNLILIGYMFLSFLTACSDTDDVPIDILSTLTSDTHFILRNMGYPEGEIVLEGTLGEYLNCLKKYKDIIHVKSPAKNKRTKRQELWISDVSYIDIRSIENQTFIISIEGINKKSGKKLYSDTYAVNCDLSLLKTSKTPTEVEIAMSFNYG